jgi:hydrogenase-4 membrane subunit HyfE
MRSRVRAALSAALPIVTIFLWLCLLYGWEAWGSFAPWLNSDEFEYAQLSRAVALTGHEAWRTAPYGFVSLYVYLVAPAWWLHDTAQAYGLAKAIGVAAMTAVVFPTYGLARMVVSKRWAMFAATGAALIPALAYSSMLLLEPVAYPWATLCFYLLARALVTRGAAWIAVATVACLAAPLVRLQLVTIVAGAVAAAAIFWFAGAGGHRLRRNWGPWHWSGFVVLAICAAGLLDVLVAHQSHVWSVATENRSGRMLEYGLRSVGALTIGLGVLPMVAGLTALAIPRREPRSRERRAFTSVVIAMVVSFGLYAAAKAAYVSTLGVTGFVERNLIYLAPLLFIGTALVLEQRRAPLIPLLAATAFTFYLVTTTPYHMEISVFFDAPGLAVLPGLHRGFGLTPAGAKVLLIALTLGSAALLLLLRFSSQAIGATVAVLAAGAVLFWNAYGEISFARSSHEVTSDLLDTMPRPLDWVDHAVPGGTEVYYLGQSIDAPEDVLQLEFWNRKVQHVWSTDGTAPGPGPTLTPDLVSPDGRLEPASGVEYVVADSGVSPVGRVLERKIHTGGRGARTWTLVKIAPPLRLRQSIDGIYPDGWGKPATALNQFSFAGRAPGIVKVHVFRTRAARRYPATVRVTLGTLVPAGATGGRRPSIATIIATRMLHVRNELDHEFVFHAPSAPFRVETSVTPFPHDRDPVIGDPRDLGANVVYTVTPRKS